MDCAKRGSKHSLLTTAAGLPAALVLAGGHVPAYQLAASNLRQVELRSGDKLVGSFRKCPKQSG